MTTPGFLPVTVFILLMIVLIGYFNEKVTKLTYEIALMLFSVAIGGAAVLTAAFIKGTTVSTLLLGTVFFCF